MAATVPAPCPGCAQEHELGTAALRSQTQIPARRALLARQSLRKEAFAPVDPRRRENRRLATIEERADLLRSPTNRCCRGNDLGANAPSLVIARGQPVDRGFVETRDGSERPRNQVQLVLYDQIRRVETGVVEQWATAGCCCAVKPDILLELVDMPEKRAALPDPGKAGEFVDRGNQKAGKRR